MSAVDYINKFVEFLMMLIDIFKEFFGKKDEAAAEWSDVYVK